MTASLPPRSKPRQTVCFSPAITGPSGAALHSYSWAWREGEKLDKEGELVATRVSDWDCSEPSTSTSRDLVHKFYVRMPDGSDAVLSGESVPAALGYTNGVDSKGCLEVVRGSRGLGKLMDERRVLAEELDRFESARKEVAKLTPPAPKFVTAFADIYPARESGALWVIIDGEGATGARTIWPHNDSPAVRTRETRGAQSSWREALTEIRSGISLQYAAIGEARMKGLNERIARAQAKLGV